MGWICLVILQSCSPCRQVQLKSMFSRHGSQMVSMTTVASLQTGTTNAHLCCSVKKVFWMKIFWEVSVFSQKSIRGIPLNSISFWDYLLQNEGCGACWLLVLKPATLTLSAPSSAELAGRISLACWFCNSSYTCLLSHKIHF